MKFIIIGLGSFGSSLADKLTQLGHEVIGVDKKMERVEEIKERVSQAICLDCIHLDAVLSLPLKNTDVVVVSIGEDEGASLLTTALIKKMNVPRLISRSVSSLHETILEAMDVSEIVRPEEESAERWAKKLSTTNFVDTFELTENYSITQVRIPAKFDGMTIEEVGFNNLFNVVVLTVIKDKKDKSLLGVFKKSSKLAIEGVATATTLLTEGDIMVLYGHNDNIRKLLNNR